ncbi:hypothetical protein [Catalinimonas niigatensis]|uniref:hypothetical protein n=1 Tax=Catalinimonas niigatensis TaxID=1397264 RepID=UPI0026662B8F|nr:hypothetical protein [Catalinimonas niigatensis]WPP48923.1 hypothetical protein PZB72_19850 [Catalinimonas niigatensis]
MKYQYCNTRFDNEEILLIREEKMSKNSGSFLPSEIWKKHNTDDIIVISQVKDKIIAESYIRSPTDEILKKVNRLSLQEVEEKFNWINDEL